MASVVHITGMDKVRANIKKYVAAQGRDMERGYHRASLYLLRRSQYYVPVFQGELRGSGYYRVTGKGKLLVDGVVGYTAEYAAFVHERTDLKHGKEYNRAYQAEITAARGKKAKKRWKKRRDQEQAKFLEKPAREERGTLLALIAGEAEKLL